MNENLFTVLSRGQSDGLPNGSPDRQDQPFLTALSGASQTYGQVLERSSRFAGALHEAGVKPGDRVLVKVGTQRRNLKKGKLGDTPGFRPSVIYTREG